MYKKNAFENEITKTESATPIIEIRHVNLWLKVSALNLGNIIPALTQSTEIVTIICKSLISIFVSPDDKIIGRTFIIKIWGNVRS